MVLSGCECDGRIFFSAGSVTLQWKIFVCRGGVVLDKLYEQD